MGLFHKIVCIVALVVIIPGCALLWHANGLRNEALTTDNTAEDQAISTANLFWASTNSNSRNKYNYETFGILAIWLAAALVVFAGDKLPAAATAGRSLVIALYLYMVWQSSMCNFFTVNMWNRMRITVFDANDFSFPKELKYWLGGAVLCYIGAFLSFLSITRFHIMPEYRIVRFVVWATGLACLIIGCLACWTEKVTEFGDFSQSALVPAMHTLPMTAGVIIIYLGVTAGVFGSMPEMATTVVTLVGAVGIRVLPNMFEVMNLLGDTATYDYSSNALAQTRGGYAFCWLCMMMSLVASVFIWLAPAAPGTHA